MGNIGYIYMMANANDLVFIARIAGQARNDGKGGAMTEGGVRNDVFKSGLRVRSAMTGRGRFCLLLRPMLAIEK